MSNSNNAKVREERNSAILKTLLDTKKTVVEIAEEYSVSKGIIQRIKRGALHNSRKENGFNPSDPMVRSDAMKIIRRNRKDGFTLDVLASKLKATTDNTRKVIKHLVHHDGYNIVANGDIWRLLDTLPPAEPLNLKILQGEEFTFGIVSDAHMVSKYCRLDVLEAAYNIFQERGVKVVLDAGNIIDGEFKHNMYEIETVGVHNQAQYVADHRPQKEGITTYFISAACHDGWYQEREGMKIGWYIQKVCEDAGRNDLKWIGHIEADILLDRPVGKTHIRLIHPGGGSAYALSYPSQKMVESFQGGDKPHILIMGHYHKFDVSYPREVVTIQPGCIQDQTPFMRKKHLGAHVGFCIVKLGMRLDGTAGKFNVEWFPFYDRKYHQRLNQYGGELLLENKS